MGTVSRAPIEFGDWNYVLALPRGPLTMHRQILAGLERLDADAVFLCESDVLYHPSHFEFEPEPGRFCYNTNVWKTRYPGGHCVWTDNLQQVSGICADRELLLEFYRRRVDQIDYEGFDRHYEPGRKTGELDGLNWQSEFPNLDIRHGGTLTRSKWHPSEFRNKRYARGWREASEVDGWGVVEGRLLEILDGR